MLARALIVLLSVLNLGVAAWWIAHDPPPPPAAPQLPPGVTRLQLVSEHAAARGPAPVASTASNEATPAAPPASVATVANAAPQCFSFGPFASGADAAATRLKPLVRSVHVRAQAPAAPNGWRVYLPPLPSLEQAQAIATRIGAAGFSDLLVVREGAEANSIALGLYRSEEAAKKRADALNAAGFAAQAEAVGGPAVAPAWLDVVADAAFDPRRTQALIAAAQFRKADCPAQR